MCHRKKKTVGDVMRVIRGEEKEYNILFIGILVEDR